MKVERHRLLADDGAPCAYRASPNQSRGTIAAEVLVMHYTAGGSAESSVRWLCDPRAQASAHLVIGREGTVTQLVDFDRKAWHAGVSRWDDRNGVNGFSIGIELANAGALDGGPGRWRTAFGAPIDDVDVIVAPHSNDGIERAWERYSESQLRSAAEAATTLADAYGLTAIVGHDEIAPDRKLDPGPAFPMRHFRSIVEGRKLDAPPAHRTTSALNIRTGPGTEYQKLDVSPLPPNTRVEILAAEGVWRHVDVLDVVAGEMDVVGWVHGRYLSRSNGGAG